VEHPGAGPFAVGPAGAPRILLFHGLTGAPSELWPLGLALAEAGYRVEAPLLPGHGTTPYVLSRTSAEDVLATARQLATDPAIEVVGGLSMGSLIATIVAGERPKTRALLLLATALRLTGRSGAYLEAARRVGLYRLPIMMLKGPPETGTGSVFAERAEHHSAVELAAARAAEAASSRPGADGRYDRVPARWGLELHRLQEMAAAAAPRVGCPALLLHGMGDRTAGPDNATRMAQLLGGSVRTRFFDRSPHVLTLGPERGAVAAETVRFLQTVFDEGRSRKLG
jgi:carboxylesterase